jgi:regulatory protein
VKISSIKQQKKRKDRLNLYVDGEFRLSIAGEVAVRRGLRPGREIDDAELAEMEREDGLARAKEAALRLLAHRQRSERELRQRLATRRFDAPTVDACIEQLRSSGLVDDQAFAEAFSRDRIRSRPSGRPRLEAELRAKGIDAEVIDSVLDQLFDSADIDEKDLARRAARKFTRRKGEDPHRTRRRFHAFLARRGFSGDVVSSLLDELHSDE